MKDNSIEKKATNFPKKEEKNEPKRKRGRKVNQTEKVWTKKNQNQKEIKELRKQVDKKK